MILALCQMEDVNEAIVGACMETLARIDERRLLVAQDILSEARFSGAFMHWAHSLVFNPLPGF